MSEIACPSCGAANPPTNRFCGSCGDEAERYRVDAAGVVRDAADGLSGPLQEAFASRPDVAELLA